MVAKQLAGCDVRRSGAAAAVLAKVVTPTAAHAFQGLRSSMRRLGQLTKEIQRLGGELQLRDDTILTQAVADVSHCLSELRRLADAHRQLAEVPESLETVRVVRGMTCAPASWGAHSGSSISHSYSSTVALT